MRTTIIGIAGGTASGKTTIARAVASALDATVLEHDRYYRTTPREIAEHPNRVLLYNYDHPDAFETALLVEHLNALREGRTVRVPRYDYASSARLPETEWGTVAPCPYIVVDGILIFSDPDLRATFDHMVFVRAPADVRLARRMRRDTAERGQFPHEVVDQYLNVVRPMHLEFVEPSALHAHLQVDGEQPVERSVREILAAVAPRRTSNQEVRP